MEFLELRTSLAEVIDLTQDLLREALQAGAASLPSSAAAAASEPAAGGT